MGPDEERDAWGRRKESHRAASEWVVTRLEHLRIVTDELWERAHEALGAKHKTFGFKRGSPRPAGAIESKYLLSGFAQCGVCGGSIVQTWSARKPGYRCWYNHSRGRAVCANSVIVDMRLADDAVLRAITRDVLDPEVVAEALDRALEATQETETATAARVDGLRTELGRVEAELVRYAEAIADADALATILDAIKGREQRRDGLRCHGRWWRGRRSRWGKQRQRFIAPLRRENP